MKNLMLHRILPALLCMALALGLTACGGRGKQPAGDKTGDTAGTLSGSKGEKDSGAGVASGSGERGRNSGGGIGGGVPEPVV